MNQSRRFRCHRLILYRCRKMSARLWSFIYYWFGAHVVGKLFGMYGTIHSSTLGTASGVLKVTGSSVLFARHDPSRKNRKTWTWKLKRVEKIRFCDGKTHMVFRVKDGGCITFQEEGVKKCFVTLKKAIVKLEGRGTRDDETYMTLYGTELEAEEKGVLSGSWIWGGELKDEIPLPYAMRKSTCTESLNCDGKAEPRLEEGEDGYRESEEDLSGEDVDASELEVDNSDEVTTSGHDSSGADVHQFGEDAVITGLQVLSILDGGLNGRIRAACAIRGAIHLNHLVNGTQPVDRLPTEDCPTLQARNMVKTGVRPLQPQYNRFRTASSGNVAARLRVVEEDF